jgi:hypothetical protein
LRYRLDGGKRNASPRSQNVLLDGSVRLLRGLVVFDVRSTHADQHRARVIHEWSPNFHDGCSTVTPGNVWEEKNSNQGKSGHNERSDEQAG